MKNGMVEDALVAWEKSIKLDPANEVVKRKIQETREKLLRVKGERSKVQP
jgi:hypothetical protein